MTFEELNLTDDVLDALYDMNFSECTPIQEKAIPAALDGRDLIAVAQTGTGKTAAFLLPVINELGKREPSEKVKCVVMTPTRELAMQIDAQLDGFSYFLPISSLAIYGGTDGPEFARQERALRTGAEVIIATPGRLLAHLQMGYVDLNEVEFFILDEADRMLDMGFYDDIMSIVGHLPEKRQTLMFSATMPPKIQKLAETVLKNPVEIKIAVSRPTEAIDQNAIVCHDGDKTRLLCDAFDKFSSKRVIVFASSKLKVKDLSRELRKKQYKVGEMHSDLEQADRDTVMRDFRAGNIDILVATDIVARGIDIDDIAMVVNYDVPHDAEDYVHRIGRTARAGAGGVALTLVGDRDRRKFAAIEKFLGYKVKRLEWAKLDKDEKGEKSEAAKKKTRNKNKVRKPQPKAGPTSTDEAKKPANQGDTPQNSKPKKHRGNFKKRHHKKPKNSDGSNTESPKTPKTES